MPASTCRLARQQSGASARLPGLRVPRAGSARRCAAGAVAACLGLLAAAAQADGFGGGIGLTSDKVYRGLSQSGGDASLLADLAYRTDTGWAVGLGAASLQGAAANTELTWTLSRGWQLGADWTAQLGLTRYDYARGPQPGRYKRDELSATAGWRGRLYATLMWSPDTTGRAPDGQWRTDQAAAFELNWHQPLAGRVALDAGAGYYDLKPVRGAGYGYGSIGLSLGLGAANAYVTWITSGAADRGLVPASSAGNRWSATLLWSF